MPKPDEIPPDEEEDDDDENPFADAHAIPQTPRATSAPKQIPARQSSRTGGGTWPHKRKRTAAAKTQQQEQHQRRARSEGVKPRASFWSIRTLWATPAPAQDAPRVRHAV
jgi:hypothetical protein